MSTVLRVAEAQSRDVGRGIARIDPEVISELGLTAGDIVEISGKRKTMAICWPGYSEDRGKRTVRIDGYIRGNAGVSIDEKVSIKKVEVKEAGRVNLAPTEPLRITGGEEYLRQMLEGRVVSRGDNIPVNIMGRKSQPHSDRLSATGTRRHRHALDADCFQRKANQGGYRGSSRNL